MHFNNPTLNIYYYKWIGILLITFIQRNLNKWYLLLILLSVILIIIIGYSMPEYWIFFFLTFAFDFIKLFWIFRLIVIQTFYILAVIQVL